MAYSFPVALDTFFADLPLLEVSFSLSESIEVKRNGKGEIFRSEYGDRYWFGTVTLGSLDHAGHESQMARLRVLQRPGASFLVSPRHFDGQGSGLNAAGTITTVSDARQATFGGLGASRPVVRGRFVSWLTSGVYHLHQFAEAGTTTSGGALGPVEVVPDVVNYTAGQAVQIAKPVCKAVLIPGSVAEVPLRGRVSQGVTFAWMQSRL